MQGRYDRYAPQRSGQVPAELMQRKSVAVCIVLSIVTLGIYSVYWWYTVMRRIKLINWEEGSPGSELLLCYFIPFYSAYWAYTRGKKLSAGAAGYGIWISDNGAILMVLNLLGLSIISVALLQADLNVIAENLQSKRSARPADSDGWTDTAPNVESEWIDT